MDAIQQGHIARTRELLESSSLGDETKESLHDCLTTASQAANGCPPEERAKYSANAILALSNVMIRMTITTPKLISDSINQHLVFCQAQKSKPALSWESKGFLPAGSIKGGYAVMLSIVLAMCIVGYGARLYFNYKVEVSDIFSRQQIAVAQKEMEQSIVARDISEIAKKPN